jgi:3-hydroxypropanoate dehydrogenase
MTVSVNPKRLTRHASLGAEALEQLFTDARTHGAFLDRPVPEGLLREALDLAKMGPTAANNQPLRIVFLRSKAAKERLRPATTRSFSPATRPCVRPDGDRPLISFPRNQENSK